MMKRALILLCLTISCGLPLSAPAFDAIVAFGDSLTDTGNVPAEPVLHYQGRWSNGPLWIEYLSQQLGFPYNASNNFAHSGGTTGGALGETGRYVPVGDVSQTLFVVWAGGNDFLQQYQKNWFSESSWLKLTTDGANNISNAVVNLQAKGARYILVPNTVDVTTIPLLNKLPGFIRSYLQSKVKMFNNKLSRSITALQATYPNVTIYRCDVYLDEHTIIKNYKKFGFTKAGIDALADPRLLDKSFTGPGANYVFWDPIHPTSKAHGVIAGYFYAAIGSP